jgi:hypothetical protein
MDTRFILTARSDQRDGYEVARIKSLKPEHVHCRGVSAFYDDAGSRMIYLLARGPD